MVNNEVRHDEHDHLCNPEKCKPALRVRPALDAAAARARKGAAALLIVAVTCSTQGAEIS